MTAPKQTPPAPGVRSPVDACSPAVPPRRRCASSAMPGWRSPATGRRRTGGRSPRGVGVAVEPFYGPRQAGIATAPSGLRRLRGARRCARDRPRRTGPDDAAADRRRRPAHPGAAGAGRHRAGTGPLPARLTVTFGFGPGLYRAAGIEDRRRRPSPTCRPSASTSCNPAGAEATCSSRSAPTTRSPSRTPSGCWSRTPPVRDGPLGPARLPPPPRVRTGDPTQPDRPARRHRQPEARVRRFERPCGLRTARTGCATAPPWSSAASGPNWRPGTRSAAPRRNWSSAGAGHRRAPDRPGRARPAGL